MPPVLSLRHVALNVVDLEAAELFFVGVLGFREEWRPDADNLYLISSNDNLALHRVAAVSPGPGQLDHIGLMVPAPEDVDAWAAHLTAHGFPPDKAPRTHRDGARSLYVRGPEGVVVQIIHHPPIRLGPP